MFSKNFISFYISEIDFSDFIIYSQSFETN